MLSLIIGLVLTQTAPTVPQVPPYPERNEHTLYEQIGQCNADLSDFRKWAQSLVAELAKRDAEIEKLKGGKKEEPPKEPATK